MPPTIPASTIWRDFVTDGVSASGAHRPAKSEIRDWGAWVEALEGGGSGGSGIQKSRADAIANFHPQTAPEFILTAGYSTAGDGGGAMYANVGASEPSHEGKLSITQEDLTVVWYEIAENRFFPEMFGAVGDSVTNDATAIANALAALPSKGGVLKFNARTYLIDTSTIDIPDGVRVEGVYGDQTTLGTVISLTNGAKIDLGGSRGVDLRDLRIESDSTTVPAIDFDDDLNRSSYPSLNRLMVVGGRETVRFNNVLEARVSQCRFLTIAGSARCIFLDGSNENGAGNGGIDAVEFVQCVFGSAAETTADVIVFNGDVASIKFVECPVLFGRKGMVLQQVGGTTTRAPRFVYFTGGGFENNEGACVDVAAGAMIKFTNFYASNDAPSGVNGDVNRPGFAGGLLV